MNQKLADTEETAAAADVEESEKDSEPNRRRRFAMPKTRRGRILVVVLIALVLAGAGTFALIRASSLPEDAAFAYGDRIVSTAELDGRVQALHALYGVVPPEDPAKADGFRRDVAKSVAVSMILDHAAADRNVVVADKQARDVLDRYIAAQFGEGGRDAFVAALGNSGTSEPAVLDEVKRQLTAGRLMEQVVGPVTIGEDQLRAEFAKRGTELGTPERRSARNIVVPTAQDAAAVLDELRGGTPIEAVAASRSLDGSTKQNGGALGELTRQQLEQPVGDAIFSARQGDFYGPVQGKFGWNVGRVDAVLGPVPAQFDQVHDSLRQTLQGEESLRRWRNWLGDEIRAAHVEYAERYQPADPDAPPSVNDPAQPPR